MEKDNVLAQVKSHYTFLNSYYVIFCITDALCIGVAALSMGLAFHTPLALLSFFVSFVIVFLHRFAVAPSAFGIVKINSQGIEIKNRQLKWSELTRVTECEGYVQIRYGCSEKIALLTGIPYMIELSMGRMIGFNCDFNGFKQKDFSFCVQKTKRIDKILRSYSQFYRDTVSTDYNRKKVCKNLKFLIKAVIISLFFGVFSFVILKDFMLNFIIFVTAITFWSMKNAILLFLYGDFR